MIRAETLVFNIYKRPGEENSFTVHKEYASKTQTCTGIGNNLSRAKNHSGCPQAPSSSVGGTWDPRSRGPGFETCTGQIVMGLGLT